ncbi:MAG TPA: hypothetical protein PKY05_02235 [Fibrobacteria bacterium]|nr:hypothetical protein [Fibrobacteria bacterium]
MSQVPRSLLNRYPEIYFGISALLLILKALDISPTNHTPWPAAILAIVLCCIMGTIGVISKYKRS